MPSAAHRKTAKTIAHAGADQSRRLGNAFNPTCPTRVVLDQIANKWTVLVLSALGEGPLRFNALKRRLNGVSQKILAQTLRELERNGLVHRCAFATVPVTVEYSLTPLGHGLTNPVNALREWAEEHISAILSAQRAFDARRLALQAPSS